MRRKSRDMKAQEKKTRKVTAAVIERDGKVLCARRKPGLVAGGLWEFPGGKLEDGEAPELGLRRELEEELGVEARIGDFLCSVPFSGSIAASSSSSSGPSSSATISASPTTTRSAGSGRRRWTKRSSRSRTGLSSACSPAGSPGDEPEEQAHELRRPQARPGQGRPEQASLDLLRRHPRPARLRGRGHPRRPQLRRRSPRARPISTGRAPSPAA